jgi:hypothetical protein
VERREEDFTTKNKKNTKMMRGSTDGLGKIAFGRGMHMFGRLKKPRIYTNKHE